MPAKMRRWFVVGFVDWRAGSFLRPWYIRPFPRALADFLSAITLCEQSLRLRPGPNTANNGGLFRKARDCPLPA
jgi:hypothetical protein